MTTCADIFATTLKNSGVDIVFGLPGGEILDFMDAARRAGIRFLLVRHESTAAFMADVTGQIRRQPGVAVSTLGPGAVNMTLGVANAYLDRSPMLAITASLATASAPYATHQQLDLNAVYRPFTKTALTLDGHDTEAKVGSAIALATAPRMGPVHIAIPSDVGRREEVVESSPAHAAATSATTPPRDGVAAAAAALRGARRPVVIVGLDVDPIADVEAVRRFTDRLGAPIFVTPKAKGIVDEDHALFGGVCAGVAGDPLFVDFFQRADLLVGVGFDPVESDKLWHQTLPLINIGPLSIAHGAFAPRFEAVGDLPELLGELTRQTWGPFEWGVEAVTTFRTTLEAMLKPHTHPRGLSGYELTRALRRLMPRDTIMATDVGSIKMIVSQAWTAHEPLTFFESNGLSAMSYALPAAMAARLQFPNRPVLCTIGDGGFGMRIAEIETCVREGLHFLTVVYNDRALSLIDVAQRNRGYPTSGVLHGDVDFAAASAAFGAWARRVDTPEDLEAAVREALKVDRPAVIDAIVDPTEYLAHHPRPQRS